MSLSCRIEPYTMRPLYSAVYNSTTRVPVSRVLYYRVDVFLLPVTLFS